MNPGRNGPLSGLAIFLLPILLLWAGALLAVEADKAKGLILSPPHTLRDPFAA